MSRFRDGEVEGTKFLQLATAPKFGIGRCSSFLAVPRSRQLRRIGIVPGFGEGSRTFQNSLYRTAVTTCAVLF